MVYLGDQWEVVITQRLDFEVKGSLVVIIYQVSKRVTKSARRTVRIL